MPSPHIYNTSLGIRGEQLRFFTRSGELVITPQEAEAQERQRAEEAEARAERLLRRLQELGVELDEFELNRE